VKRLKSGSLNFDLLREILSGRHEGVLAEMQAAAG